MPLTNTFALVTVGALAISTAAAPPSSEHEPRIVGELGERIAAFVQAAEADGFSGAVLAAKDGKVVAALGAGYADLDDTKRNTPATLFEIASVTKQFTGAAIMRLVQDGKLNLDDSIAKHLPTDSVPESSRAINIEHLLRHTSGIPGSNSQGAGHDIKAVLPSFLRGGPRHEPGTHWEYWNQGYAILSEIISSAAGEDYIDYTKNAIFKPAGMKHARFTGDQAPDETTVAIGRSARGAPRSAIEHPYGAYGFQYRGMGGIVSSAWDLWRWDRALHGNDILKEDSKKQLFAPGLNDYALGWFVRRDNRGRLVQSHGGGVRGFICELRRYPEQDAFIVVLANRDDAPLRNVVNGVEQILFEEVTAGLDAKLADALTGEYRGERGRLLKIRTAGPITRAEIHWSPGGRGPVTHATIERDDAGNLVFNDGAEAIRIEVERESDANDAAVRTVSIVGDSYQRIAVGEAAAAPQRGPQPRPQRDPQRPREPQLQREFPIDPGMNIMIGTRPYRLNEHGVAHLPPGMKFHVMPRYTGTTADGRSIMDNRLTLVFDDPANQFWPVIVRMDDEVAEKLVKELQAMLETRKMPIR